MPRERRIQPEDRSYTCPVCLGTGIVPDPDDPLSVIDCPRCDGNGRIIVTGLRDVTDDDFR